MQPVSVIIPAYNEESGLGPVVKDLQATLKAAEIPHELLVIDDGSTDRTGEVAASLGATIIQQPENMGYGASLKRGIAAAANEWILITDADGTYTAKDVPTLLEHLACYHMVVGARQGQVYEGSFLKSCSRRLFRFLVEFTTGRKIPDVNSGLRAFRKGVVVQFYDILSNRFSFTTTITLALMLNGYFVKYVPVEYRRRIGTSKIQFRDTLRAIQIIVQAILYYNPIKLFLIPSAFLGAIAIFLLAAAVMAWNAVLLLAAVTNLTGAVIVFAIGLLADILRRGRLPK